MGARRACDRRCLRLSGAGLVAVDQVSVGVGHLPEPGLRVAVAAVRRVLCVRLSQIRPLRRSTPRAAARPHHDGDTRRTAAGATETGSPSGRRSRTAGVQRLPGRAGEVRPPETEEDHHMTTPGTVPVAKIRTALLGYRVMAWTTGIWLIALCYEIVSHLVFHHEIRWIEVVHGWVYFIYVLAAFNLAIKVRWPIGKTIGVLLAGTIPLLGIIVEHFQTRNVKARFGL